MKSFHATGTAALAVFAILALGCPPAQTPPPPDASDASPPAPQPYPPTPVGVDAAGDQADQVCSHLAAIGCAQPPTCATTIRTKQGVLTDFKLSCLLGATSADAASACGTVHCGTVAGAKK